MKSLRWMGAAALILVACGGSDDLIALTPAGGGGPGTLNVCEQREATATSAAYTPLTMRVLHRPQPVLGSDGRHHVVYEIELVNGSDELITLQQLSVLGVADQQVVASFAGADLSQRLVVRDRSATPGTIGAAQAGVLYLHLGFDSAAAIPAALEHTLAISHATPPATQTGGCVAVAAPTELVFDPPLRGERYIAGDGCCDAVRHTRATLPLNGRYFTAQRFAIDWEQLDPQGRIYVGDPKAVTSYMIYGKPAYAVADALVVGALDGLPNSPTGSFPPNLPLAEADGNHVVLDLGNGSFALYAHFKPGSVRVKVGDRVKRGQVLGEVGSSGNSSEPHLHFHVTDGPSPLASSGLPHRLTRFTARARGVSTAAFDKAIIDGLPIATEPVANPGLRERMLAMDLWIVDFPE